MAQSVVAFVGENANGILDVQSQRFHDFLRPLGLTGHVLRMGDPAFIGQLDGLLKGGIAWAWGYAGIGAGLTLSGRNLWEAAGVPFVSVLADAPYIMPPNHLVPSRYVVNGYIYKEWLTVQQTLFRSAQISTLLPMGVIPNPARDLTRWSDRPVRMAFVKGGSDPARQRASWVAWPARLRAVLEECAHELATKGTGSIVPVVTACLAAHSLVLEGARGLLFGLLHELDTYVRALRATAMARALLPLPVDIIGDGWAHVSVEPGKARFHPAMEAGGLDPLYADTQILVNVTPNFGSGAHERVLRGFASRCRVLSDDNDHGRAVLSALPSYHGVEWCDPDLADNVAAVFHDSTAFDDRLDAALAHVEAGYDPAVYVQRMAELAALIRVQDKLACYAPEAA